ncbi:MAG: hypothetical protein LBT23_01770 [Synergistaceae bacterium]|jgi:exopolyphosphatase/guanosine-5'-triphosphate,3'-diphosphate pyrophosphatase|nr:hypothetical protein [Synergistaceae bacterium]
MRIVDDLVKVSRLGEDSSETGLLSHAAMQRSLDTIRELVGRAKSLGAAEIIAVGTQAMRTSRNADEFIGMVRSECGVEIRVISGDEEAALSFLAVSGMVEDEIRVFDVGGGSSEIAHGVRDRVSYRRSVPVGALSLFGKFFQRYGDAAIPGDALDEACRYVGGMLENIMPARGEDTRCVGIGGTVATLAAVYLGHASGNAERPCGTTLSLDEIAGQIKMYAGMPASARKFIPGLPPERADIILPGGCIISELMKSGKFTTLTAIDRGLRHGLMEKLLG